MVYRFSKCVFKKIIQGGNSALREDNLIQISNNICTNFLIIIICRSQIKFYLPKWSDGTNLWDATTLYKPAIEVDHIVG